MRAGWAILGMTLGLALLAGPAAAQRAGTYVAQGTNPDGSPYSGMVELQPAAKGTWLITWRIGGSQIVRGVGLVENGVLAAGYLLGGQPGVVAWRILPDGSMRGTWTVNGDAGTENLFPR